MRIGYQGVVGSWSETAAKRLAERNFSPVFTDIPELVPAISSGCVVKLLLDGDIDFGVMALHNTIGGPVEETVAALENRKYRIIDSISMDITHDCYALRGSSPTTHILGHSQALLQCTEWLDANHPDLPRIAVDDGLRYLRTELLPGDLVIAPPTGDIAEAAEVLASDIQNTDGNQTLFLLITIR